MDEKEFEEKLEKARGRLILANRVRMFALVLTMLAAGVMTVGYMYFPDSAWVTDIRYYVMWIVFVLVLVLFVSTFIKIPLIAAHNGLIKQHDKEKNRKR